MIKLFCDIDNTLSNSWKRIFDDVKTAYEDEKLTRDMPLFYSTHALRAFKNAGWDISYLTGRLGREVVTSQWLQRWGFPAGDMYYVGKMDDKIGVLKEHKPDLFIDDFMGGHENKIPAFRTATYLAAKKLTEVEPFRNNWWEIVYRHLGIQL